MLRRRRTPHLRFGTTLTMPHSAVARLLEHTAMTPPPSLIEVNSEESGSVAGVAKH